MTEARNWLAGDGEMAERVRRHDWSATPLGPIAQWPRELRTTVALTLSHSLPMLLCWGEDLIQIYNDAYIPVMNGKHPRGFGQSARLQEFEGWENVGALCDRVWAGQPVSTGRQRRPLLRGGEPRDAWYACHLAPVCGADGAIAGAHLIAQELTGQVAAEAARDRAEAEARDHESRFETVAELLGLGWSSWELGTGELNWDVRTKALWGLAPTSSIDLKQAVAAIHPDDRHRVEAALSAGLIPGNEPLTLEYRVIGIEDGVERWVQGHGRAFFDGSNPTRFVGAVLDITERKATEVALRDSQAWLREGVELAGLATYRWDPRTGKIDWDERLQALWDLSVEANYELWKEGVHPADRDRVEATVRDSLDPSGEGVYESEYRIRNRRTGDIRWISTRARTRFVDGEAVAVTGAARDITERKLAEEHQRTLLAELQHRVRNTLSVVRSIAQRTAATSDSLEDMGMHLQGRLDAFSRVQSAVTRNPDAGVDLKGLIEDELLAHAARAGKTVTVRGPDTQLLPKAAESISLAVHELATNAVKYGVLGRLAGRLSIVWETLAADAGGKVLRLVWSENVSDGRLKEPERQGFGMELLQRRLPYEMDARTSIEFRPEGLRFTLEMPLPDVSAAHPHGRQSTAVVDSL
jgi:PAS domain S-box-containing protein